MTAWVWILIKMLPHLNWLFSSNISNFRENPFSGSALKLVFFKASQHFSLYENGHFYIFYLFSSTLHSSFDGKHFIVDKKKYIFEFTKQPTLNIAYSLPMNPNFQKWPNVRLPVHCWWGQTTVTSSTCCLKEFIFIGICCIFMLPNLRLILSL